MTRQSRRAVLAATGAALASALAGCTDVLSSSAERTVEYDESTLAAIPGDIPRVPPSTPVQPTAAHVAAARDRIRSLLADADVSRVPNEVVRARLAHEAEAAREALTQEEGEPRVDAVAGLAYPRSEAMFAHAGLAAFDGELTPSDVAERRERHHRDAASFLDDHSPLGPADAPADALAQHVRVVGWASTGARLTEPPDHREYENTVLHVAERAQSVEWGRAYAADARRLFDHYESTLEDPRDYGDHFAGVAATLVDDVEAHAAPPDWESIGDDIDRDIADTPARELLEEFTRDRWIGAQDAVEHRDEGADASAVVFAMRALAADRALASAKTAIADGDYGVPESVDPIAAERAAAVDGLRTLLDTAPAALARLLARYARGHVRSADRSLREESLGTDGLFAYAQYAEANLFATAAPPVVERVGEAVEG